MRDAILTQRLILRDIDEDDAEALFELDSDPEVMRFIGTRPADDVETYRERIRTVYMAWHSHPWHGIWIVLDRSTQTFLGWVFARPATAYRHAQSTDWTRASEIEVGYRYHRHAWGRGIATEAAQPLVDRGLSDPATSAIVGCAVADHVASIRVLEKLGLAQVGVVTIPGETEPHIKLARPR